MIKCCWYDVLNARALSEDKSDDAKIDNGLDQFPKYHIILFFFFLDFNADISKLTIRNESLYEISNDNRVRVTNSTTSKNLIVMRLILV
jgi:hypothetical protein